MVNLIIHRSVLRGPPDFRHAGPRARRRATADRGGTAKSCSATNTNASAGPDVPPVTKGAANGVS
jgi:hypothetical protein